MGTRNLTKVIFNGETKVAQYGQWDGYPEGQGATCFSFLKNADLEVFKTKLNRCKFMTKRKETEMKMFMESIGSKDGWMTSEQAEKWQKEYPYLTRDHGAEVLIKIYESTHRDGKGRTIWLQNSSDFMNDGSCEWSYVINLDENTLTVRAYGRELKVYNIDELPETVELFAQELNELERLE